MKTTAVLMAFLLAVPVFAQTNDISQMMSEIKAQTTSPEISELESGGAPLRMVLPPHEPKTIYVPHNAPDTLQMFVDQANPGDELVVAAGIYDTGGRQLEKEGPAVRLVIDKPLTLRSEEGPAKTFISGGPSTRCIYMTNGVRVIGFTVINGETCVEGPEGNKITALSGGGVWSAPEGVLENCIVVSNKALWYGGGLYGGHAVRCVFTANDARRSGGGASDAQLENCLVQYNRAGRFGGGTHHCDLVNCTITHNRAEIMGGGVAYGMAQNTVLHHNQTLLGAHNFFDVKMSYCCSMPQARGPGNIGVEPGFKNTDQGVFSPAFNSPLIDAGTNNCLSVDLIGHPRILDGNNNGHACIDIGAYEYVHPTADSDKDGIPDMATVSEKTNTVVEAVQ